MSESVQKIKATIAELENELRSLPSVDRETREMLAQAVREIQTLLRPDDAGDIQREPLVDRLGSAAQQFETSHPTLTGIIGRLIDGLAQMGI